MTAKHAPASPLPTGEIDSNDLLSLTLPTLQGLVNRSDAYPRLVEALREIAGERTQHLRANQMQECIHRQKDRAAALLKELGE